MVNPPFNQIARSEAATTSMGTPPVFPRPTPPSMPPATMENIMGMLCELKTRLDERDTSGGVTQPPLRPDPDPPYSAPSAWQSTAWAPGGPSTSRAGPTYMAPSSIAFALPVTATTSGFGNRGAVGFRHPPLMSSAPPHPQPSSSWDVAPPRSAWDQQQFSHHTSPPSHDPSRLIKMDLPIFDGTEAPGWITRVEYYFDHIRLPEEQKLHYVVMLFAPSATDWIFSYRANNPWVTWSQFLDDMRRRFDLHYFVNYMELLAKLTQTGSVAEYNKEFERLMNHIKGVSEATLLSIYLGGLRNPLKSHVQFQHPVSVAAAMSIAMEFDSAEEKSACTPVRRPWQNRDSRPPTGTGQQPRSTDIPSQPQGASTTKQRDYSKLPVVRLTAAERAEKTRLGLC